MSIFDNMLELNNSFLLIALIIIAVICIYLLYSNLTKSGETASLKSGLTALIQQNKKRDEIINFLLERIENLEHNTVVPSAAPVGIESLQETVYASTNVESKHDDIDDILSAANVEQTQVATSSEVLDILESIDDEQSHEPENIAEAQTELPIHEQHEQTVPVIHVEAEQHEQTVPVIHVEDEQQPTHVTPVNEMHNEFQELESEFDGLMMEQNEPTPVSNDLVSALLDADEESLAGDHEFDLTTVPKSKDKLNAQYTIKQLKTLS